MAGEMFGAPIGINTAVGERQQDALLSLRAVAEMREQQELGPKLDLFKAQTRNFNALAGEKEEELKSLQAVSQFMKSGGAGTRPAGAYQIGTSGAQGNPALQQLSQLAQQQLAIGEFLTGQGHLKAGTAAIKEGADLVTRISNAEYATVRGQWRQSEIKAKQLEQRGGQANWAMKSPENYNSYRLWLIDQGDPFAEQLPDDFAYGKEILAPVVAAATKTVDQMRIDARKLVDDSLIKKNNAQAGAAGAAAGASKARTKQITEQADRLNKYGGNNSAEQRDMRKAVTEARRATTASKGTADAARQAALDSLNEARYKDAPLAPTLGNGQPDKSKLEPGKIYRTPRGPRRYMGDDQWAVIGAPPTSNLSSSIPDDDDDEGDDDE